MILKQIRSKCFFLLLCIFLVRCLIVVPTEKRILSSERIHSEVEPNYKEEYDIDYEFQGQNLILHLHGGMQEEDVQKDVFVRKIQWKYEVKRNESFLIFQGYKGGKASFDYPPFYYVGAFFEYIFTVPFRTYSPIESETIRNIKTTGKRVAKEMDVVGLRMVLRIRDMGFADSWIGSKDIPISLISMYDGIQIPEEIEVLLYRDEKRVSYKTIPVYDAIRRTLDAKKR